MKSNDIVLLPNGKVGKIVLFYNKNNMIVEVKEKGMKKLYDIIDGTFYNYSYN